MSRSRNRLDHSDPGSDTVALAPGRRTLTASLPARPTRDSGTREIDPASIPPPSPIAGDLSSWSRVAFGDFAQLPVQLRASGATATEAAPGADKGPGDPLPAPVERSMGRAFGADLSDVRIHHDASAARMGAIAYTQGTDIHFSPGAYDPVSAAGKDLLGHELAHVVQQRAGVVTGTQGKGGLINADPALEAEADREGAKAARGEAATVAGAAAGRQARPMRGGRHAIQGMWWIVKDLGQGVLEGILKEGGKEMTKEGLKKVLDGAAPTLLAALEVAMQSPELRAMLGRLALLGDAKTAALEVAKDHAARIAGELAAWVREQMPDLPEHLVPEMVRDLQARIEARLKNSYAAEVMAAVRDVGGAMLNSGISQHLSNVVDRQLISAAGGAVRGAAETAAAPVMDAAHTAVDTARQVQETIGDIELPIPAFKPIKKIGRKIGETIYHGVRGSDETASAIGEDMLDPLTHTTDEAVRTGQEQVADRIRTPGSGLGVNPATVYKGIKTAREFATAQTTDQQLNALAAPAVDYGMGALGMMAAPAIVASLPVTVPAAAAAVVPAMVVGGSVALGQRYVMPAVRQATEAAAPHLEAFGNTTIGTPVKKVAQTVHTAANMFNLGMTMLTAPLPFIGGGWDGIEAARQSADNSVNNLLGRDAEAPERAPATARVAARERHLRAEIGRCTREASVPMGADAARRERAELRQRLAKILAKRLELVDADIAHADALVKTGQRHTAHLEQLRSERVQITADLDQVRGEIAAEPPSARPATATVAPRMPASMFAFARPGMMGGVMNPRFAMRRPLGFNPLLSGLSLQAMGMYVPPELQLPMLASAPRAEEATPPVPVPHASPVATIAEAPAVEAPAVEAPAVASPEDAAMRARLDALGPRPADPELDNMELQHRLDRLRGVEAPASAEHVDLPSVPTHPVNAEDVALRQRLRALGGEPMAEPVGAAEQAPITEEQIASMPAAPTHDPLASANADQALQARLDALGPHEDDQLLAELELEYRMRRLLDQPQPQVSDAQLASMPAAPTHAPRMSEDAQLQQRLHALGGPSEAIAPPVGEVAPITEQQLASMPAAPTHAPRMSEDAQLERRLRALGGPQTMIAPPTGEVAPITEEQLAQMPAAPTHAVGHALDPQDEALHQRLLELNGTPASSGRSRQAVALTNL